MADKIVKRINIIKEIYTTEATFLGGLSQLDDYLTQILQVKMPEVDKAIFIEYQSALKGILSKPLLKNFMVKMDLLEKENQGTEAFNESINANLVELNQLLYSDIKENAASYQSQVSAISRVYNMISALIKVPENQKLNEVQKLIKRLDDVPVSDFSAPAKPKVVDCAVTPIQRSPRYELLLKDLLEHTPRDHAAYSGITELQAVIKSINDAMNASQKGDSRGRGLAKNLWMIENLVKRADDLMNNQSRFLDPFHQSILERRINKEIVDEHGEVDVLKKVGALEKLSQTKQLLKTAKVQKAVYKDFIKQYEDIRNRFSKARLSMGKLNIECNKLDSELENAQSYEVKKSVYDKAIQMLSLQKEGIQLTSKSLFLRRTNKALLKVIDGKLERYRYEAARAAHDHGEKGKIVENKLMGTPLPTQQPPVLPPKPESLTVSQASPVQEPALPPKSEPVQSPQTSSVQGNKAPAVPPRPWQQQGKGPVVTGNVNVRVATPSVQGPPPLPPRQSKSEPVQSPQTSVQENKAPPVPSRQPWQQQGKGPVVSGNVKVVTPPVQVRPAVPTRPLPLPPASEPGNVNVKGAPPPVPPRPWQQQGKGTVAAHGQFFHGPGNGKQPAPSGSKPQEPGKGYTPKKPIK